MDALTTARQLVSSLAEARSDLDAVAASFDALAHSFVEQAQAERKEVRAALVRAEPGRERKFSQIILAYRFHNGSIDLYWTQIFRRRGDSTALYRRIPMSKGVAHVSRILKGAEPEEVEVIRAHEFKAREFRKLWGEYLALRRQMSGFQRRCTKLSAAEEVSTPDICAVHS